ncbi:hypothetical protein AAD041_03260 [Proteus mirabilis]
MTENNDLPGVIKKVSNQNGNLDINKLGVVTGYNMFQFVTWDALYPIEFFAQVFLHLNQIAIKTLLIMWL